MSDFFLLSILALFSNIVLWILDSLDMILISQRLTFLSLSVKKYPIIATKYISLLRQRCWDFCFAIFTQWCFLHFNICVFPPPLRGPWRSSWSFLWLLCRTLPWRYLCGNITKEDLVLCPQPPHPLCAPLLDDPVGLPASCQLWGEDQPGWGIIISWCEKKSEKNRTEVYRLWDVKSYILLQILFLFYGFYSSLFHNYSFLSQSVNITRKPSIQSNQP